MNTNDDAKKFFNDNPEVAYWYYTPTLRVPNPRLKPWRNEPREEWP